MIGVNPITAKNNSIATLHLDELHGDDTSSLHRVAPHAIKCQVSIHPSFIKMEYNIKLIAAPSSTSILEIGLPSM
jgi:hypothetical protein